MRSTEYSVTTRYTRNRSSQRVAGFKNGAMRRSRRVIIEMFRSLAIDLYRVQFIPLRRRSSDLTYRYLSVV